MAIDASQEIPPKSKAATLTFSETMNHYFATKDALYEHKSRDVNSETAQRLQRVVDALRYEMTKVDKPMLPSSLAHSHARVRRELKLPPEFVLYSLRHTALTRLGEQGTDAFTIMRIAGHSTIATSQRYVHPSAESVGRAIARLESANEQADVLADRTDAKTDTALPAQSVSH